MEDRVQEHFAFTQENHNFYLTSRKVLIQVSEIENDTCIHINVSCHRLIILALSCFLLHIQQSVMCLKTFFGGDAQSIGIII